MELTRRSLAVALGAATLAAHEIASAQSTSGGNAPAPTPPAGPGQVPFPQGVANVQAPGAGMVMPPEYAKAVARMAYIWGWPMINMLNRKIAITKAPHAGLLNGVLPAAPRG